MIYYWIWIVYPICGFLYLLIDSTLFGFLHAFAFCRRLQENQLETLDGQIFLKLRSLRILDISQNRLSSLAPDLFQSIYHIKVINLSDNKLLELPSIQEQEELEELDLSKNKLHAIDAGALKQLKNLKTLRLSENFIGTSDAQ